MLRVPRTKVHKCYRQIFTVSPKPAEVNDDRLNRIPYMFSVTSNLKLEKRYNFLVEGYLYNYEGSDKSLHVRLTIKQAVSAN